MFSKDQALDYLWLISVLDLKRTATETTSIILPGGVAGVVGREGLGREAR